MAIRILKIRLPRMNGGFTARDVGECQGAGWADQDASATSNAAVRSDLEGGTHLLLNTTVDEADRSNAYNLPARPDA
jgi:hypothetical protein